MILYPLKYSKVNHLNSNQFVVLNISQLWTIIIYIAKMDGNGGVQDGPVGLKAFEIFSYTMGKLVSMSTWVEEVS